MPLLFFVHSIFAEAGVSPVDGKEKLMILPVKVAVRETEFVTKLVVLEACSFPALSLTKIERTLFPGLNVLRGRVKV